MMLDSIKGCLFGWEDTHMMCALIALDVLNIFIVNASLLLCSQEPPWKGLV